MKWSIKVIKESGPQTRSHGSHTIQSMSKDGILKFQKISEAIFNIVKNYFFNIARR